MNLFNYLHLLEPVLEKIDQKSPSECWPWLGRVHKDGFGLVRLRGSDFRIHRVMWMLDQERQIPPGLLVLQRCENKLCCNPAHLYLAKRITLEEVQNWEISSPKRFSEPRWRKKYGLG